MNKYEQTLRTIAGVIADHCDYDDYTSDGELLDIVFELLDEAGLAVGGFISANPLLGTHILWAGLIVYFIGGNFLAAVAGTWVGNPFTFPFIWIATYSSGSLIMGGNGRLSELPTLSFGLIIDKPLELFQPVILPMLVGSLPVGLALGVATYYPSLWAIKIYQKRRGFRIEKKRRDLAQRNANKPMNGDAA